MMSQIIFNTMLIGFLALVFIGGPALFLYALWKQDIKRREETELRRRQLQQLRESQDKG